MSCPGSEDRGQFAGSEVVVRRPVNIVTCHIISRYLHSYKVLYLNIYKSRYLPVQILDPLPLVATLVAHQQRLPLLGLLARLVEGGWRQWC